MKTIKRFHDFVNSVFEADGYGTSPFLLKKEKDIYNYFFYIDTEKEGIQNAFRLLIGKYSDHQTIDGAKNSYCVLSINKISSEMLEDIAVSKEDLPPTNSENFKAYLIVFWTISSIILRFPVFTMRSRIIWYTLGKDHILSI